jgi:hypothetical protein
MKLTIELVPRTSWYNNVRSNVSKSQWDEIRSDTYTNAKHKCEVCGDTGKNQGYIHNVECHEIWEYDVYNHLQTLKGFVALCPLCHKTKHPGLAQINGEENLVISQLMKVNGMDEFEANNYLHDVMLIWDERSVFEWTVNISYLSVHQNQLSKLLSTMNKFRKE